ncbi:MAG TPA: alpha/beta fold hydrolase [Isosphaeraceae bacterium]
MDDPPVDPPAPRRRKLRRLHLILAFASLVPIGGYVGVSYLVAERLTRPSNHPDIIDARLVSPDAQAWSTRTSDGLTLRGWYCPTERHRRLIVLVHGMGASWVEMAEIGRLLCWRGYDILLFDLRGHGRSDPARLSMGRREREDLRAVLSWAESEGYTPDRIGWLGHSLGASTLLMEAARNPEIQVAVVDSPFADLPDLLNTQLTRHSHLPSWFNPGILFIAHRAFGIRTDDLKPIRSAPAWGARPLLLIHGEADSIVPVRHAYALASAVGPACQSMLLPGVEHVGAFHADSEAYVGRVDEFFDGHLSR